MKKSAILITIAVIGFMFREEIKRVIVKMSENWTRFDALFNKYGLKYGVSAEHLKAVALNESSLGLHPSVALGLQNPSDVDGSKSMDGLSWGIMQVTLGTARTMDAQATPEKLNNAEYSIDLAARYIASLQKMFDKRDARYWEYVFKSYNQGPTKTRKRELQGLEQINPHVESYWQRFLRNLKTVKEKQK